MSCEGVVVFMKGYLGDAVLATPLLHALVRECRVVYVITEPGVIQILEDTFPGINFVSGRKLSKPTELLAQAREARALGVKTAILVNRSFRSALCARMARIPHRIGHGTEGRAWLLTRSLVYDHEQPEVESYLDLARAIPVAIHETVPKLVVSPQWFQRGAELASGASIALQPGARYSAKQWPLERMAELAKTLDSRGHRLALLGGSDELEAAQRFEQMTAIQLINLVGKCSLKETMGVLRNMQLVVGSDTGMMHVAAGVGSPTVTIFGPNNPAKWAHREGPHEFIAAPGAVMERVTADEVLRSAQCICPEL